MTRARNYRICCLAKNNTVLYLVLGLSKLTYRLHPILPYDLWMKQVIVLCKVVVSVLPNYFIITSRVSYIYYSNINTALHNRLSLGSLAVADPRGPHRPGPPQPQS